jgi:autotransporter passenger strand-loop-strand repeat protein
VGTSVTSAAVSGSTLSVTVSGGATFTYQLAGQEANTAPRLQSDGSGGTDVILALTAVGSGQTLEVFSGQTSTGITVLSGGTLQVDSGGIAVDTIVSSGGSLVVLSSGLADPTVIYAGGTETISAGGSDDGAQISGGVQYDYGLATSVTIFAGSQMVNSGGTAGNTTISSGGQQYVGLCRICLRERHGERHHDQ